MMFLAAAVSDFFMPWRDMVGCASVLASVSAKCSNGNASTLLNFLCDGLMSVELLVYTPSCLMSSPADQSLVLLHLCGAPHMSWSAFIFHVIFHVAQTIGDAKEMLCISR